MILDGFTERGADQGVECWVGGQRRESGGRFASVLLFWDGDRVPIIVTVAIDVGIGGSSTSGGKDGNGM